MVGEGEVRKSSYPIRDKYVPPCVETHSGARTQRATWGQEEGSGFSRKEGAAVGWGSMRSDRDHVPQPLLSVKSVVWEF